MSRLGPPVACALLLTACGGSSVSLDLEGNLSARNLGGGPVVVGQPADYTAFLVNASEVPVNLESASLMSLESFRAPELLDVAVESGRLIAFMASGWPPTGGDFACAHSPATWCEPGSASRSCTRAAATCVSTRPRVPCPASFVASVQKAVERQP
jgi:hypothetical protein